MIPAEAGRRFRFLILPKSLILLLVGLGLLAQIAWLIELLYSLAGQSGLDVDEFQAFLFGTQFGKITMLQCGLLAILLGRTKAYKPVPVTTQSG